MEFVNKIVVILRNDLLVWQELNVTAHILLQYFSDVDSIKLLAAINKQIDKN